MDGISRNNLFLGIFYSFKEKNKEEKMIILKKRSFSIKFPSQKWGY